MQIHTALQGNPDGYQAALRDLSTPRGFSVGALSTAGRPPVAASGSLIANFGSGAAADEGPCVPDPHDDPECREQARTVCGFTPVVGGVQSQAGGTSFSVAVQPLYKSNIWAKFARIDVRDSAHEEIRRTIRLTAVECAGKPRDELQTTAPTAATNTYQLSSMFGTDDILGLEVPWGLFGKTVFNRQLLLYFYPNFAAAITVDVTVTVFGIPIPENHQLVAQTFG